MTLIDTIIQLKDMGVSMIVAEGYIQVHIPAVTKETHPELENLLSELKAHKPEAIELLRQVTPQVKPVRAILLWSEKLQGYFWWMIDKSALQGIKGDPQYGNVPVYDNEEIDIVLSAKDDQERKQLHIFKRTFGAKIHKNTQVRR